jgi:hypothetical protein
VAVNYRHLRCRPETVFEVLADGWLMPSWVVGASRMRAVQETWPQPGSDVHHSFGVWPAVINDATSMLEWDPPRHAMLKARAWPIGSAHVSIDVQPRTDGCVVRMTEDVVGGPARLMPTALADLATHLRNRETLRRIAFIAEGREASRAHAG